MKSGMIIEHSVWHTVVKVHKNNYVSFCYKLFGSTAVPAYKVNVFYWNSSDFEMLQPAYKVIVCFLGINWETLKTAV